MKKIVLAVLLCACTAFLLSACSSGTKPGSSVQPAKPAALNISYVKLPLNVPSIVEKRLQYFENEFKPDGIQVSFPEITQGPKMTEAMAAGSLDFANALGGTSAILAAANGVDLKIIGVYSRAPKAFTIMVTDPSIHSAADLRGKKIAGPKGTILHQLLLSYLKNGGVKPDEVSFVNMDIPPAQTALLSGNVDAALIAGPAVAKGEAGGARILTTGEGLLDATIVIAARTELIKQHPELVTRYMNVHRHSLEYMKQNRTEAEKMAAEETGLTPNEVKSMYDLYDFTPDVTENDIKDLEDTQEFLKQNGMLQKTVDIRGLIQAF